MHLYHLTLQKPTCINAACHGQFSGTRQQEICVARGSLLELLRPDPNTGKVHTLLSHEMFGVIRTLSAFRLTGATKDYVVLGTCSGRMVILEYDATKNAFLRVHQETYGKTGCRRVVPGQYLAVDTKGRAIMTASIEKAKLVYIMNRDAQARLTISSPLEAHKSNTVCYHITNVDVGFENPMFAALESDFEEMDLDYNNEIQKAEQMIVFYELDLGLNHVVRKHAETLPVYANHLISVPGGNEGPSGVLVCGINYIMFKNLGDQPDIKVPIPRRRNDLDNTGNGLIIVTSATHRTKSLFFFLVQTEQGDIFKLTLDVDDGLVTEIRIKYFDTVPVANNMCILKTGFLFVASEFGNHYLYQIARLGDDDDEPEFSSRMTLENENDATFFFAPRGLHNLVRVDELESLSPILASHVGDLANEDAPQFYTACGRGPTSSLRCLRHGLEVAEMAISELPGSPTAVWTVKRKADDEYDAYIVVSFINATLVLSIGETVEEVTDSGFLGTTPTITCAQLGDDALIQVYPEGIRHIRSDRRVNEWKTPGRRNIVRCTTNNRQVVVALNGGELIYFELDPTGQLNEYTERRDFGANVVCMSISEVLANEQRARLLAIGLEDKTVRIISLDVSDCLSPLAMQALPAAAESVQVVEMGADDSVHQTLFLNIGLENGVLLRTVMDSVTGDLSDTRTRYLGTKPVKLFKSKMQGRNAVLAMSSRTWLLYFHQNRFHLTPLSYEALEYASSFASEQCPEGIVAIASNTLRILALEKLGVVFNQLSYRLSKTPRRMIVHQSSGNVITIETDHNTYTRESAQAQKKLIAEEMVELAAPDEQELAAEMAAQFLQEDLPEETFGVAKAGIGMWSSIVRVMNPVNGRTYQQIELPQNEAALSIALCQFSVQPQATFVLVGAVSRLRLRPRSLAGGFIYVYLFSSDGERLDFVHRTPVEEAVHAITPFKGRVLIGVGRFLRLYELGKKKLLRKTENKHIPDTIVSIEVMGFRIYCSDVNESIHYLKYKQHENQMVIFADDIVPRRVHTVAVLDYDTVVISDKFGTISLLRLPKGIIDDVQEDPTGHRALWDKGFMTSASQKAEMMAHIYVGEMVTTLQKTTLIPGGSDAIVYGTIGGAIGCLVPMSSKDDLEFFQHLEMHMRSHLPPLSGRDHLSYRSFYSPVKSVVDGDLCEQFNLLEAVKQKQISDDLERQPSEVAKKLEDIRTRYAF